MVRKGQSSTIAAQSERLTNRIKSMKKIEEVYPNEAKQKEADFCPPWDYNPLLQSFEYEIMLKVDDSDFEGDSRLIFRNNNEYGILIFGWGSCSGCDALQACTNMKEISDLRDSLNRQIRWGSLQEINDYINNKNWELEYSWFADETKEFVKKAKLLLENLLHNA